MEIETLVNLHGLPVSLENAATSKQKFGEKKVINLYKRLFGCFLFQRIIFYFSLYISLLYFLQDRLQLPYFYSVTIFLISTDGYLYAV